MLAEINGCKHDVDGLATMDNDENDANRLANVNWNTKVVTESAEMTGIGNLTASQKVLRRWSKTVQRKASRRP